MDSWRPHSSQQYLRNRAVLWGIVGHGCCTIACPHIASSSETRACDSQTTAFAYVVPVRQADCVIDAGSQLVRSFKPVYSTRRMHLIKPAFRCVVVSVE